MSKIIVPTDFTSVSEVAIRYASELSNHTKSAVHLLHIVGKENERAGAEAKMKEQAHKLGIGSVGTVTAVGNIFEDIPDTAERENAELIVMGTHGLRGMQFIVGSNALRVVSEGINRVCAKGEKPIALRTFRISWPHSICTKKQNRNCKLWRMSL